MFKNRVILFVAILFVLFSLFAEESSQYEPRIVNGTETSESKWKESFDGVVLIFLELSQGVSICTATLIDPEVLLTARHCVAEDEGNGPALPGNKLSIHKGTRPSYYGTPVAKGKRVLVHKDDDIALLLLDRKIPGLTIYPIRDYPIEEVGDKGTVAGYGITSSTANDSGVQRWGETTLLSFNIPGYVNNVIEVGRPTGLCSGDSGGPLFTEQNGEQVISGVSSFVVGGSCSATGDSYSMHVLKYRDWIQDGMKELTGHDLGKVCGNGTIDQGEVCEQDDVKNCAQLGDYSGQTDASCNADCSGYDTATCHAPICGDGAREGDEACDDGNTHDGDYCSSDCLSATGQCGDGQLQNNEECDDGNTVPHDGCDQFCKRDEDERDPAGCSALFLF
ncbi:trypsin-like serine protease [bacterium]|nr:trypsin-like serine protease [bacterium]